MIINRFSIFLALSFFALGLNATDTLLVDTLKTWSVVTNEYSSYSGLSRNTDIFQIKETYTVNDTNYFKIYENQDTTDSSWQYSGYLIRQDSSNKVYIRSLSAKERLLYNFNLMLGDTITQLNMFDEPEDWIVEIIDTINLNEQLYKRLVLGILDCDGCLKDTWIEGIGSLLGLLTPGNFVMDFSTELLCVKKDEEYIYTNSDYSTCYIYSDIKTINLVEDYKIFPNPFKDYIIIETATGYFKYTILTILGQIIISDSSAVDKSIYTGDLHPGPYILRIENMGNSRDYLIIKE